MGLDPDSLAGPDSTTGPTPDPTPNPGPRPESSSDFIPISGSPTSVSLTACPYPDILLEFSNSEIGSNKRQTDILLHFDSDSGVDEDLERSEEDEVLDSSDDASDKARKPGEIYTEYDFDFLNVEWLELVDESLDTVNSSSSSSSSS